jgi:glycosyltransferase involved in cell wall biosynthesis
VKVSVVCPTYGRPERHAALYECFRRQTHPDLELLVLDDSPRPSRTLRAVADTDPRVTYRHVGRRASIGAKRNALARAARGEVLAHFDDDDAYAPGYVAAMVALLGDADLAKLSAWEALREADGSRWRWDTRSLSEVHWCVDGRGGTRRLDGFRDDPPGGAADFLDATLWGYGFSYVYRRAAWLRRAFSDMDHGEDYEWVRAQRRLGAAMVHAPDARGLVVHALHPASTSRIFPQARLDGPEASP